MINILAGIAMFLVLFLFWAAIRVGSDFDNYSGEDKNDVH